MTDSKFDELLKNNLQELNDAISPSDQLLYQTRARMAQAKPRSKWIPRMQKMVAVVACTLLIFTGAVNLSPAFASAAAKVPIVRELVKAVAFDPSMKAAIEHEYVQLVKKTATDNGFTLDVEYLIADKRNLTVYYKMEEITALNTEDEERYYEKYRFDFELLDMNGEKLDGYGASWDYPISEEEKEALNTAKFNFTGEATLPEQVQLQLIVKEAQPLSEEEQKKLEDGRNKTGRDNYIAGFEEPTPEYKQVADLRITLTIDRSTLFNVRTIELNHTIELEGQQLVFDAVEIYPTQIRVLWHADEANTHLIDGLKIELQSKKDNKWEGISNGISGIGAVDSSERQTWLESNWFSEEVAYQLAITQYGLIPKDQQYISYDYTTNTFTNLSGYIELVEAVPCETGLFMVFNFENTIEWINGQALYHESVQQCGSGSGKYPRSGNNVEETIETHYFYNTFIVSGVDYENEPIEFKRNWAPPILLEEPIIVPIEATGE